MDQHLPGGLVNAVVRIGDTVRRPPPPNAGFVHDLLAHLEHGLGMDVPPGPLLGLLHQSFLAR
jgi:hypothetical protein